MCIRDRDNTVEIPVVAAMTKAEPKKEAKVEAKKEAEVKKAEPDVYKRQLPRLRQIQSV